MNVKMHKKGIGKQTGANLAVSVAYQIIAAVCSLILPRYILFLFGSDVNGILQSVGQLLNYVVLMECGVGGLITASFYKPLAEEDDRAVSDIFNNARRFFNKISYAYIGLTIVLAFTSKLIIRTDFDFRYVCSLVVILSINYYFNYYFAMTHRLLMRADQKIRIVQGIQSVTLVLNAVLCIITMKLGGGIHIVKIVSTLVFLLNPIAFRLYVKKNYFISHVVYDKERTVPRKTDGMIHHIAFFVHMNTDIVLLSIVCGTKEVSVYSIYNSVICVVENFFTTMSESISAALGSLIANGRDNALKTSFELYQMINNVGATFVCVAEALLILPFVKIYTNGITDAFYIRPVFAYLMIAAQWFFCIRMPYGNVITAAGHYRQTKAGAYIEVFINIGISLLLVKRLGICGVAFGTMIAMAARTVYMAWYLSRNLLHRRLVIFLKDTVLNIIFGIALVWLIGKNITVSADNLFVWGIYAVGMSVGIIAAILVFSIIVNYATIIDIIKRIKEH